MDRHVKFVTQLSHLVAMYARPPVDEAAERAALQAARGAVKNGAIELFMAHGTLHGGRRHSPIVLPEAATLVALCIDVGLQRLRVAQHARPDEIRFLATLLGSVAGGQLSTRALIDVIAEYPWSDVSVACAAPTPAMPATAAIVADVERLLASDRFGVPLTAQLPAVVERLLDATHRELFARLISACTPSTLHRLLEPVRAAIETAVREGEVVRSVRLVLSMFACERCAIGDEMRRPFSVAVRRLTKPTLLRAYAMLYADAPEHGADVEEVLARFGEDGAEAVADQWGSAPTLALRTAYLGLLGRLPGTNDALLAMLDDDRPVVLERAIALLVAVRHPDLVRVLGEQLSHQTVRVRQAAVRGLAAVTESALAANTLVRAVEDASPEVRLAAAVALQSRRDARLAAPLTAPIVARLDAEPELDVLLALVTALGRLGASDGVQKLIALATPNERLLRRRDVSVLRLGAIEAMGEARTPAAMVALQKLLEDREPEVREAAARLYSRARRQTAPGGMPAISGP